MIWICRFPECSFGKKKQGRGISRIPVWQDYFAILSGRRHDLGRVSEVETVVALTMELDPTLNDSGWPQACVHRHRERGRAVRRHRYRARVPLSEGHQSSQFQRYRSQAPFRQSGRSKPRLGHTERLVSARWVVEGDVERTRMTD